MKAKEWFRAGQAAGDRKELGRKRMKVKEWYQARIRWAVMEQGRGLQHWKECEHMFLSESRETAFQEALRIGREEEHALVGEEDSPEIECRLAEVVYLESVGSDVTRFEVQLGEKPARERISFDYIFQPEARMPPPLF
jgi:hypothetical protein